MLSNFGFEDLVLLVSNISLFIEGSSVLVDVGSELSQGVGQSISGGEKNIVDHIVSVEDISISIFDFLSESGDISVVVVSSTVKLVDELVKFSVKVSDKFINGFNQLTKVTLSLHMQFGVVQNEASPVR